MVFLHFLRYYNYYTGRKAQCLGFPNFLCKNSSFFFVNVKSIYVHEVNRWPAMDRRLKSKWPPGKERKLCDRISCLVYCYWYSVLWILKLSILKCFWYITCVLVEPYSLSTDVLKSLNVCDLGAFGLFTIYWCSFLWIFNILECL